MKSTKNTFNRVTDNKTINKTNKGEIKMKKRNNIVTGLIALVIISVMLLTSVVCFSACASQSASVNEPAATAQKVESVSTEAMLGDSPEWVTKLPEAQTSDQLFVVAAYEKTNAWVSMHQKDENGKWHMIMTTPGFIGKNGLGKTKEGDGKTPVGTFGFNAAFGIATDPGCAIPYTQADNNTYWSGDVREGMQYNKMVDIRDYPDLNKDDSEHIMDYTRQYQYCLNISYNSECNTEAGSAIFLHCLGPSKPYTGGCVAIPENQMLVVMQNVKPDCKVVIDSLDNLGGEF